jgi:drug/metabolite transporter (DMT)-like permease
VSLLSAEEPSIAVSRPTAKAGPPLALVIAAFAAVYIIWGSTYLGMAIAIQSIPPLLMAGGRAVIAGFLLYGVMRMRGEARPEPIHWLNAAIVGGMLLAGGNGGVSWAQQFVPSGLAALVVAAVPLWMILIDWLRPGGSRPQALVFAGLALGFAGVAFIVLGRDHAGQRIIAPIGAVVLLGATISWSIGSVWSRHLRKPGSALLSVAMQMIAGGILLLVAGAVAGEIPRFHLSSITRASALAFAYLTFIGSLVGFTAYVWLLQVSTPARVSTYAYVNPLIAVLLGRIVLKEPLPHSVVLAGAFVLVGVVLITTRGAARSTG